MALAGPWLLANGTHTDGVNAGSRVASSGAWRAMQKSRRPSPGARDKQSSCSMEGKQRPCEAGLGEDAGGGELAGTQREVKDGRLAPDLDGREAGRGRPARAGAKQRRGAGRRWLGAERSGGEVLGMGKLGSTGSGARDEGNGWIRRGRASMAQTELLL